MQRPPLLLVAVGLFASLGCEKPRIEEVAAVSDGIQGGTTDTTHPYAVGVCPGNKGNCIGVCSGALIAPNLVVTARHCVDEIANKAPNGGIDCAQTTFATTPLASSFWITTDSNMKQATAGWYQVKSIARAPSGGSPTKICGNDLALLVLATNVPGSVATPITPSVQRPITSRPPYSAQITAIGYGVTGPTAGEENTSGLRRIREKINLRCIPGDAEIDCPPAVANVIDKKEFLASAGTCSGDSGSSAYEQLSFKANKPVSFGVLSRGGESATTCSTPIYTRLDSWSAFIIATAKQAAGLGGYAEPAWTVPLPVVPDAGVDAGPVLKGNGATCAKDTECKSKHCVAKDEESSMCAIVCEPDSDPTVCQDDEACRDVDGETYCLPPLIAPAPPPKEEPSGCAATLPTGANSLPFAALFALFLVSARRRRTR